VSGRKTNNKARPNRRAFSLFRDYCHFLKIFRQEQRHPAHSASQTADCEPCRDIGCGEAFQPFESGF
jgi:hypothetical protein